MESAINFLITFKNSKIVKFCLADTIFWRIQRDINLKCSVPSHTP